MAKFKFTKERIDGLPRPVTGKSWEWHRATQVRGLQIGVGPKSKTFYLVRKINGVPERIKLGPYPDLTIERAIEKAEKFNAEIAGGANPAELRREQRDALTLGQAFEQYMERHIEAKGKKRGADLRQLWERCLGELPDTPRKKHARERSKHPAGVNWQRRKIDSLSRDAVAALHVAIGKTTPVLANRVVELLSAIYGQLANWGLTVENPAHGVEPFKEHKRDRFLKRGELPRFFAALDSSPHSRSTRAMISGNSSRCHC
jgi:hypothetical protein